MPLEPHEELKLAWEIAVMEMQIDRGRLDIEKIRQDIDKTRLDIDKTRVDIDKTRADMALDLERLKTQNRNTTATMVGAFAATLAAGAAIGHFFIK
jgi:hypothetical protein